MTTLDWHGERAGVVIPEWARSPFLLHPGVRWGSEITVVGGAAATISPTLAQE